MILFYAVMCFLMTKAAIGDVLVTEPNNPVSVATTDAPTTAAATTEEPAGNALASDATTTKAPTAEEPAGNALASDATTTKAPTAEEPAANALASDATTTKAPNAEAPAVNALASDAATAKVSTTEEPAANALASDATTAKVSTTEEPAANALASDATTIAPTTESTAANALAPDATTTKAPTIEAPITGALRTDLSTTVKPTTDAATTVELTTRASTIVAPTTDASTTVVYTTNTSISVVHTTITHTTESPTTIAPTNLTSMTTKPIASAAELKRYKNHCIGPRPNFLQIKKIRKGTLLLKCRPPTPYCNFEKNLCVSIIPTNFNCDGVPDGQYPHIADCRGSIICKGGKEVKRNCPMTASYDYNSKQCLSGKRKCVIPNCVNKTGSYVRHPAQRNLYVFCLAGVPSSLYACPTGYIYTFNKDMPCRFECPFKGIYPDIYNRKMYYQCSSTGRKLVKKVNVCPEGNFNKTSGVCGY